MGISTPTAVVYRPAVLVWRLCFSGPGSVLLTVSAPLRYVNVLDISTSPGLAFALVLHQHLCSTGAGMAFLARVLIASVLRWPMGGARCFYAVKASCTIAYVRHQYFLSQYLLRVSFGGTMTAPQHLFPKQCLHLGVLTSPNHLGVKVAFSPRCCPSPPRRRLVAARRQAVPPVAAPSPPVA